MKFSIKDFFSECDQIRRKLRIWSYLVKKSLMENFVFCAVSTHFKLLVSFHIPPKKKMVKKETSGVKRTKCRVLKNILSWDVVMMSIVCILSVFRIVLRKTSWSWYWATSSYIACCLSGCIDRFKVSFTARAEPRKI